MNKVFKRFNGLFLLLAFTIISVGVQAQEAYTLTGTVVDSNNGEVLPGSNIVIAGTSQGTATDFDGKFELSVKVGDNLEVSFMGYTTQTVAVTGQKTVTIKLEMSTDQQLADVVVVGYGVQKRSHLTGSVAKLDDKVFAETAVARADQALVGKLSGVEIATTDASAGASPKILIRGLSSISQSTNPLIVVDGFPIPGDLSSVDMNDVASIEVLKDAASAAIYGSRGSNGVIMITTKSGKSGKVNFEVNLTGGIKNAYRRDDIYPSIDSWISDLKANGFADNAEANKRFDAMKALGADTDWQDEALQTGKFKKYQLGASGGGDWGNFYIGGSYLSEDGILRTNNYEKFSLRANVTAKLSDRIEVGLQASGNSFDQRNPGPRFHDVIRTQPWLPVYHTEESLKLVSIKEKTATWRTGNLFVGDLAREADFSDLMLSNNVSGTSKLLGIESYNDGKEFMSNAYVSVKIIDGLTFKSTFGAYYSSTDGNSYMNSWANRNGLSAAASTYSNTEKTSLLNENTLNYTKTFGKHAISLLGGFTYQKETASRISLSGSDYPNDLIKDVVGAGTIALTGQSVAESALISGLFRANYTLLDRYIVSAVGRADGSSRFGSEKRWGWFPSISLGWRVSEEAFMKNQTFISSLKLRATYGTTGSNNIDDYATISNLVPVKVTFGDVTNGYAASNVANPILAWESTIETNLGFDLGVVDNRFNLSFNYYQTVKDQLLLDLSIPAVTGFTSALQNAGQLKTKGFEIDFNSVNISTEDFTWRTIFNISHNSNELVEFNTDFSVVGGKRPTTWIHEIGSPLAQFYGYRVEKGFTVDQLATPYLAVGTDSELVYVKDLDGDGEITTKDREVLGSPFPDFIWGLTNEFNYKDFDLSIMINGSQGAETFNIDPYYFESQWKGAPNSDQDTKGLQNKSETDYFVQDASYICLRNVTLGYNAPKTLANKIGVSGLRAFVSAQNLLYKWADDYTSFNPEGVNDFLTPLTPGYQRGATPIARSFTLGLNLKF